MKRNILTVEREAKFPLDNLECCIMWHLVNTWNLCVFLCDPIIITVNKSKASIINASLRRDMCSVAICVYDNSQQNNFWLGVRKEAVNSMTCGNVLCIMKHRPRSPMKWHVCLWLTTNDKPNWQHMLWWWWHWSINPSVCYSSEKEHWKYYIHLFY